MKKQIHEDQPIQILFNYWEVRPTLMGARLDDLIRKGVTHLATFIPWQAVESDISHTLARFLQSLADRKMTVSLILTPEVGVHYPNSGLPKDIIGKPENQAAHSGTSAIPVTLPPNGFNLPSFFAPEFMKRYYSFLSRMDNLLADLERGSPHLLKGVNVVLTGSFWKYYRSPQAASPYAFGALAGDESSSAGLAYRQRLEQYYSDREFLTPSPMSANRWKTRALDEVNRRWFHQQSENQFRNRTYQLTRRKAAAVSVTEMELFTPEADPGMLYNHLLSMLSGGHGDFSQLSAMVDEAAARASHASSNPSKSFIHWTSLGGFRSLADPEKQFLLLKSLLLLGGQGGGILVDESEWFSLSIAFRARVESFAKSFSHGDLRLRNRALYLAPHLWSGSGALWEELRMRVGAGARLISSIDFLSAKCERSREATLLVVDPSWILTQESLKKITAWAQAGHVVVLPRSPLYTEAARADLERIAHQTKRMEIDLGIPYRLHALGEGKLIIYDLPENLSMAGEALSSWQTFLTAVLSVAEVETYCRLSDSRLCAIPFDRKDEGLGLFVLNGTRRPVSADIIFQEDVAVSDLAMALGNAPHRGAHPRVKPTPASRFALDVPPCGILPLSVDGMEMQERRRVVQERRLAAESAGVTRSSAQDAALSELPGFDPSAEGAWN